jgi:hypothetical protein
MPPARSNRQELRACGAPDFPRSHRTAATSAKGPSRSGRILHDPRPGAPAPRAGRARRGRAGGCLSRIRSRPSGVAGPVDFCEFAWLAAIFASLIVGGSTKDLVVSPFARRRACGEAVLFTVRLTTMQYRPACWPLSRKKVRRAASRQNERHSSLTPFRRSIMHA